ncbi:unnamed protein product [Victoria cruziana]
MSDSTYRVETTARLAQWKINNLAGSTYRKSDPFRIGRWNWFISIERSRALHIRLFPDIGKLSREPAPIASFIIRLLFSNGNRKTLVYPEISDKLLKSSEDFVWPLDISLAGKFIIDVEFLDLKIIPPEGGDPCSIWSFKETAKHGSTEAALSSLGRMLSEQIHTDVTIDASNGSIGAHRAILASRSPVFHSMFAHNLKEKELSTIKISDMTIDVCEAFLGYLYGAVPIEAFMAHRSALLRVADKYDVSDLKEICEESLLEDIDTKNVFDRLQDAYMYQLPRLKSSCIAYLVNFGKIFDVRDDLNVFLQSADRDLISEIFQEVLNTWKDF